MHLSSVIGVGKGFGRDLHCRVITDKVIYEYDFGKQRNCKVGMREVVIIRTGHIQQTWHLLQPDQVGTSSKSTIQ